MPSFHRALLLLLTTLCCAVTALAGIDDPRLLAQPRSFQQTQFFGPLIVADDGYVLARVVVLNSTDPTVRVQRIDENGRLLDAQPRMLSREPGFLAPAGDQWVLATAPQVRAVDTARPPQATRVWLVDRNLNRRLLTAVEGVPLALNASAEVTYLVTHQIIDRREHVWLHVLPHGGGAEARWLLSNRPVDDVNIAIAGEEAIVAFLEFHEHSRRVQVRRVDPAGGIVRSTSLRAARGADVVIAAGDERIAVAMAAQTTVVHWLDQSLQPVSEVEVPFRHRDTWSRQLPHLLATSAGFFFVHREWSDRAMRSYLTVYSPSGELIEHGAIDDAHLLASRNDHVIASFTPGTLQKGYLDPRLPFDSPIFVGGRMSSASELRHLVRGDLALTAWRETYTIRLVRLLRSGTVLDPHPLELDGGEAWDLAPLGAGRAVLLRTVYAQWGPPVPHLIANVIDLQTMHLGPELPIPLPPMGVRELDAEWTGSELLIAVDSGPSIALLRLDGQLRQVTPPLEFSGAGDGTLMRTVRVSTGPAGDALIYTLLDRCYACPDPRLGTIGIAVIERNRILPPVLLRGAVATDAATAVSSGWVVAYGAVEDESQPQWESRIAHVNPSGSLTWDVPLRRPTDDPVLTLDSAGGHLHLATQTRLAALDISVPEERWIASPPQGQWHSPRLVWPDRVIYLGMDEELGAVRPWTAAVTTSRATDLSVTIASQRPAPGGRAFEVVITNEGPWPANDVHLEVNGASVCEYQSGLCMETTGRPIGTIQAGATLRLTLEQRPDATGHLARVAARVTSSTTDEEPFNNATTLDHTTHQRRPRDELRP